MSKDPAFLFYTNDFERGCQFFTDEQVGKYLRLLMAQHQHGHLSEKHMIFICKSYDKDVFSKFEQDSDGNFFNKRLDLEIDRRKNYVQSRANNKTGKKIIRKSYDNHMENENENENKKGNEKRKKGAGEKPTDLIPESWDRVVFDSLLSEFIEMRNKAKKPLTKNALTRRVQQLLSVSGGSFDLAQKIMLKSIDKAWDEFYPLNDSNHPKTKINGITEPSGIRDRA